MVVLQNHEICLAKDLSHGTVLKSDDKLTGIVSLKSRTVIINHELMLEPYTLIKCKVTGLPCVRFDTTTGLFRVLFFDASGRKRRMMMPVHRISQLRTIQQYCNDCPEFLEARILEELFTKEKVNISLEKHGEFIPLRSIAYDTKLVTCVHLFADTFIDGLADNASVHTANGYVIK